MKFLFWLMLSMLGSAILCGQNGTVDFLTASIDVRPVVESRTIEGEVRYTVETGPGADSLYLDARNMNFTRVVLDGMPTPHTYSGKAIAIPVMGGPGRHRLELSYNCQPKQAVYFVGWGDTQPGNDQVWTQGQGKYSSHWVPSFDDMREKVQFSLTVRAAPGMTVVANGLPAEPVEREAEAIWSFRMARPMSSYLLAFAVGSFEYLSDTTSSGIPMRGYYPAGERNKAELTYRYSREVFDFLEFEIGRPYPWQDYKQVPLFDFMYAGMENTGATFFSDRYMTDSLGLADRDFLTIDAHELAHQWFGNLVTEEDGRSHWLHEGFATFYAYLAEEYLLGPERVAWKLYDSAVNLEALDQTGAGTALTDPASSSLIFYEKGAWALFALRDYLGNELYRSGVQRYLESYAFSNADVGDFIEVMEGVSGSNLHSFRSTWLDSSQFPMNEALGLLVEKNPAIAYFESLTEANLKEIGVQPAWEAFPDPGYRRSLLQRYGSVFSPADFKRAFAETDTGVQKALLDKIENVPTWAAGWAESLLYAESYDLREAALFKLWVAVPEKRPEYLDRVESNGSLGSLAFRQLWWMLAALTEDYLEDSQRSQYLQFLRATTGPGYPVEARINAFQMLRQLGVLGRENYRDLVRSTEHHNWQYRLFARRLFDNLLEDGPGTSFWKEVLAGMKEGSYPYAEKKVDTL